MKLEVLECFVTTENDPTIIKTCKLCQYMIAIWPGGEGTSYNGLYGEAPPERSSFFRLQVCKRVGISQVEVYGRAGKSFI